MSGTLLRRYKRFLAEVRLDDGSAVTAHCPNPGAMTGCAEPGMRVLLSKSPDPRRKLAYTWELSRAGRTWVCVNTGTANRIVGGWLRTGRLFPGEGAVRAEVAIGRSRFDFLLGDRTIIEVKSVTLKLGGRGGAQRSGVPPGRTSGRGGAQRSGVPPGRTSGGAGGFPDAVTARGRRHVEELAALGSHRRILLYFVARGDISVVRSAEEIDPDYARAVREARLAGVEVRAVGARFSPDGAVSFRGWLEAC